eukprot:768012-Hanusia_phi.AAC.11
MLSSSSSAPPDISLHHSYTSCIQLGLQWTCYPGVPLRPGHCRTARAVPAVRRSSRAALGPWPRQSQGPR